MPDHAEVEFEKLYAAEEIRDLNAESLRETLSDLAVYTTDEQGELTGLPLNLIIVGKGLDVLRALLRAGWYESLAGTSGRFFEGQKTYFLYGRKPDAVFRYQRGGKVDRNELRLWLSPLRVEGEPVWIGQVTNFVGQRFYIGTVFFGAHPDPHVDDARNFILQNVWYSQGLQSFAWSDTGNPVTLDQPVTDFNGNPFFTDGRRVILWLSGEPYSLLDTRHLDWD